MGLWPRATTWNLWALGGPDWDANYPKDYSPYGQPVATYLVNYMYAPYIQSWYRLGALFEKFRRPNYQILVRESERGGDTCNSNWPSNPTVTLNAEPDFPPWTAMGADYSFRHTLPPDPGLYQQQATACYGFIDGHVAIMQPMNPVNAGDRYSLDPAVN
jgi:hypothetical protein